MQPSDVLSQFRGVKKEQYFTNTHEWVHFKEYLVPIGVCPFKLTGLDNIHKVDFASINVVYRQGEIIASLSYYDYKVNVYMPTDGELKSFNEALLLGETDLILEKPLGNGWLALIVPSKPYFSDGLLTHDKYQLKQRNRQWG